MTRHLSHGLLPLLLWALTFAPPVGAHEVHLQVSPTQAALLQLSYGDGQAFAFEAYELYPGQAETPAQVGRTDAQGRVVFLPGDIRDWRLKAYTADGHGLDQRLQIDISAATATGTQAGATTPEQERFSRLLLGLSLILGSFGLYQLLAGRKQKAAS